MYNTSINLSDVIRGKKNLFMYLNKRIKVCEVASDVAVFDELFGCYFFFLYDINFKLYKVV